MVQACFTAPFLSGRTTARPLHFLRIYIASPICQSSAIHPFNRKVEEHAMRAEAEALVETIKQSMGLLRRHL